MTTKCLIWTAVAFVIAVLIAVAITLGIVLTRNKQPTGPSMDDAISSNAVFPNGSDIISVQSLKQGPADMAPKEVSIEMLNQMGIRVDNSSLVAETGRLSYFYVRLPAPSSITNDRSKRQIPKEPDDYVGVRFGDAQTVNIVPLSLALNPVSGLQKVGQLSDSSSVYALQVRMPDAMCRGASSGTCAGVNWRVYSVRKSKQTGSVGRFANSLHVACGSQCDAAAGSPCATSSCQDCDGQQVAGADTPVTRRYNLGTNSAKVRFQYDTFVVKDVVRVTYEQQSILDSGCVGTNGLVKRTLSFNGKSQELRVDVEPNCQGTTGTAWNFQLFCPCKTLRNGGKEVKADDVVRITSDAQMPALTACSETSVRWTLEISPFSGKDDQVCQSVKLTGSGTDWDIRGAAERNQIVQGGTAKLSWTDGQKVSGSLNFKILGENSATKEDIKKKIRDLSNLWYAPYIPAQESRYAQFDKNGYPLRSFDNGYGLYQITNTPAPTCIQLWSWVENARGGIEKMNQQRFAAFRNDSAESWMYGPYQKGATRKEGQRVQARKDNGGVDVPVPKRTVGKCIFEDGTARTIEDAVAIKMFNGAAAMYCSWKNKVGTTDGSWQFNDDGQYVTKVCGYVD